MGFSRQEYWSGLPFPSPGDLPNPGFESRSPALQADTLSSEPNAQPPSWVSLPTVTAQLFLHSVCRPHWVPWNHTSIPTSAIINSPMQGTGLQGPGPHSLHHFLLAKVEVLLTQSCPTLQPRGLLPTRHFCHGILQARILEWVAIPFSSGSSRIRDRTWIFHIAGRFFIV